MKAIQSIWHEFTAEYNFADGLDPYFGAYRLTSKTGARKAEFTASGETWTATLYSQDSGIVSPGARLPTGTAWEFDSVREFRISIDRSSEEDSIGQQGFNAHIRPRWQGMEVENNDGSQFELSIPDGITEGVSVRASGSNVDAQRYLPLLRAAAGALGLNPGHFRGPHRSSTVQDASREVRIHKDASGPIHSRDGPIAQLAHLLENDRSGVRELKQRDDDINGRNRPGYYHTTTLGPGRVEEAWPTLRLPLEIKHYFAKHSESLPKTKPLAHPKLAVSYQVSKWDGTVRTTSDDIAELAKNLDKALHSVLHDAGISASPGTGDGGPFVSDAYFDAELGEFDSPPELNLTRIKMEQENIVVRELTKQGGLSPVETESLDYLITDGGRNSPEQIAEEHNRHVGSVRRALRRIDELVDRNYGEVSLRSNWIAELVHDSVQQMREASQQLRDATGEALLAAERGIDETVSALRVWCAKHGVDVDTRGEAIEAIRLGEVPRTGSDGLRTVRTKLREGLSLWLDAERDREAFTGASVSWSSEKRGPREMPASSSSLIGGE